MFVFFLVHVSYSFWPLNQNILMILLSQLPLYLIRNSLNIICVFCFHFIRSRPTAPPTEKILLTETALGPGGGCRCMCYYGLQYHTQKASFYTCIISLNAAIQNLMNPITIQAKLCFKNEPQCWRDLIASTPWAHVMYSSYWQDISA